MWKVTHYTAQSSNEKGTEWEGQTDLGSSFKFCNWPASSPWTKWRPWAFVFSLLIQNKKGNDTLLGVNASCMPSICFRFHMTISEASQPQREKSINYLAQSKAQVVVRDTPALSSYGGYQRLEWCRKKGHRVLQKSTETGIPSSFLITYSSDSKSPARTHFFNIASLGTKLPIEKQRKNHSTH